MVVSSFDSRWNMLIFIMFGVALAILLRFAYLQQREQTSTMTLADGSELLGLTMAAGEATAITGALQAGRDVRSRYERNT